MRKPLADFEYVRELLQEFFSRRTLRSAFKVIADQEITGWEIWFQVEFARFLSEHDSQPEWEREFPLEFDYRMEKLRYFFKPDFIIRKKHWPLDRYLALEIKQHQQLGNCISNMIADLTKVAKIRKSELDLRSYWALGVFHTDEEADVPEMIESKLCDSGLPYYESRTAISIIPGTAFSYALF
ncbi:hypothetical protein JFU47_27845 [Pseudomonas sp. TH39(2020)]|uniref:hypothetical protein n=1 Tax=Pseudomonas sp. TH39(2020) TaxID=2796349 RepID=UPI001913DF76|nr:hypothetical protein [Pseudomonas sp. TH39(2020)]MBK5400487.1 hypothetical protein [Pseudomonas sp. TH39(2020)]